jgi:predicted dehydrogenase
VAAWGASLACTDFEDLAYIQVEYQIPKVTGYIHLSWLDPRKIRTITVVGSEKMVVYDDLAEERVRIYDRGVTKNGAAPNYERPFSYRYGDVISPYIPSSEPLALQDEHFVDCIRDGNDPESSGSEAVAIVAALEAIDRSIRLRCAVDVEYPLNFRGYKSRTVDGLVVGAAS